MRPTVFKPKGGLITEAFLYVHFFNKINERMNMFESPLPFRF